MKNGRVESFQGKFRDECLNVSWFRNLWEAREKVESWRKEYNQTRPHSNLGYQPPEAFAAGTAPPASPPHSGGNPQCRGESSLEFYEFRIRKCADLGADQVGKRLFLALYRRHSDTTVRSQN